MINYRITTNIGGPNIWQIAVGENLIWQNALTEKIDGARKYCKDEVCML